MRERGPVLARLPAPRGPATTIAVIADAHVTARHRGSWKVYHRTVERLRTAIAECNRRDVDGVVFAGDLTKDGHPAEFAVFDDLVADLVAPFVAVPGNHDVPKTQDEHETPPVATFARRYAPARFPFVRRFGAVEVVGANTATAAGDLRDRHTGALTDADRSALGTALASTRRPIVVQHHPLGRPADDLAPTAIDDAHPPVADARSVRGLYARQGVSLAVSGHNHWPSVGRWGGLHEVAAPATSSFPQSFLVLEVTPTGTTVELVPLAGPIGYEEAYQHAHRGTARSQSIAEAVVGGAFDHFPLVGADDPPEPPGVGPLVRSLA